MKRINRTSSFHLHKRRGLILIHKQAGKSIYQFNITEIISYVNQHFNLKMFIPYKKYRDIHVLLRSISMGVYVTFFIFCFPATQPNTSVNASIENCIFCSIPFLFSIFSLPLASLPIPI